VSGSRARAQPSASPDPARGRQAAPSAVRSSQPHRSRNRTLAKALAAVCVMTRYPPPPGTEIQYLASIKAPMNSMVPCSPFLDVGSTIYGWMKMNS
jgi:hypothetical protein